MNYAPRWAPDFVASTTQGPIAFHEWAGISWVILFSALHEGATWAAELAQAARLKRAAEQADTKMIGLLAAKPATARDGIVGHRAHAGEELSAPVISDPNRRVLSRFANSRWRRSASARPVFIIDPYKAVRLTITYPQGVVRDFSEILGIIESLRAVQQPRALGASRLGTDESMAARLWPKSAYHEATGARDSHPARCGDDASAARQGTLRGVLCAYDGKPLSA